MTRYCICSARTPGKTFKVFKQYIIFTCIKLLIQIHPSVSMPKRFCFVNETVNKMILLSNFIFLLQLLKMDWSPKLVIRVENSDTNTNHL